MTISAMAGRRITVYRRTALVLDPGVVAASLDPDRQPARASYVQVTVSGGTGTVTVSGTVDGSPDSEVLTFAGGATILVTSKLFTAIDSPGGFVLTGLAGETVDAKAIGGGGDPHHVSYSVASDWPARKDVGLSRWPNTEAGARGREETRFYVDHNSVWSPRRGDVIEDQRDGRQFKVIGDPDQREGGAAVPHHWEIRVEEMAAASAS